MRIRKALFVLTALILVEGALEAQPVRLSMPAFGDEAAVEVHDMNRNRARSAADMALRELYEISRLVDPDGDAPGGIGVVNAAAGQGPQPLDPRLEPLLRRAQSYCFWSNGALGPASGSLYQVVERALPGKPASDVLRSALANARCDALRIAGGDPKRVDPSPTLDLGGASRLDLRSWGRGFAVDRAIAVLEEQGVTNAIVESGPVRRAIGDGPTGKGWLSILSYPGIDQPIDRVWLRDQALAVGLALASTMETTVDFIDHRDGEPITGVVAVVAVSTLAADAQGLTVGLAVLGLHEGIMRVADLKPRPSALWLLGEGTGQPLRSEYRWSALAKARRSTTE